MSTPPQVSVVIPAFNAEDTVGAAVSSMLAQSYPPREVIVVDDGSRDGTGAVLASFGDAIKVIRQENQGLAAARSVGQESATGDYIAWLDADDLARPERLEVQVALMEGEPSVMVVSSDFGAFDDRGRVHLRFAERYYGTRSAQDSLERHFGARRSIRAAARSWGYYCGAGREALVFGNFLHPPTVMLRRSGIERVGRLSDAFPTCEDWLYFFELSSLGDIAVIDEPLVDCRQSPHQMSRKMATVLLNNLASFEHLLAQHPELVAGKGAQTRRALAQRHDWLAHHLAELEPRTAAKHVARAIRYRGPTVSLMKAAAKIVLPRTWVRTLLGLRGGAGSGDRHGPQLS